MKPLNLIFAAALAISTGGAAIAQSADPFAVSQDVQVGDTFGLNNEWRVALITVTAAGLLLTLVNDSTNTTTTSLVPSP